MKLKTKILIILASTTLAITLYQSYTVLQSYQNIKEQKVTTFKSIFDTIYDAKTKTIKSTITEKNIQELENKASTPKENESLDLIKISYPLIAVQSKPSTLDQYISAANQYYQNTTIDDKFPEQKVINQKIIKDIESLINQVNSNLQKVTLQQNSITFDQTSTDLLNLSTITTDLPWSDKKQFNNYIKTLNDLSTKQVTENKQKADQQAIIDLKNQLDEFIQQTNANKAAIQSNYVTIKELKTILNTLKSIDLSKDKTIVSNLLDFTNKTESSTYSTQFTQKLFDTYPDLQSYQTYLQAIDIPVEFKSTYTTTSNKSSESKTETLKLTVITTANQTDTSLVNKASLSNIQLKLTQNQTIVQYAEPIPSASSTTSSSSSEKQTSSTSTSSSN